MLFLLFFSKISIFHSKSFYYKRYLLQEVTQECQNMNWGTFKVLLTDSLIDHLHPIQVSTSITILFQYAMVHLYAFYVTPKCFFLSVATVILSFNIEEVMRYAVAVELLPVTSCLTLATLYVLDYDSSW